MVSGRGSRTCPHIDLIKDFPKYVTITGIDLMERPVDSIANFMENCEGKLLLHFLVVLTFKGGDSIVVEKIKNPCCNGNVGVWRLERFIGITHRIPSIQLDGVEVEVSKLVDVIKKLNTEYSFCTSNCWQFADAFAVDVVELLLDILAAKSVKSVDEGNLRGGLNDLWKKKRATPSMVVRFYCRFLVCDDQNNETHRILANKFEAFLENHPDSIYRKQLIRPLMTPLEMRNAVKAFLKSRYFL